MQGHTHQGYTERDTEERGACQHRMRRREGGAPRVRVTGPAREAGPGAAPPDPQKWVGNAVSILCRLHSTGAPESGPRAVSRQTPVSPG